MACHIYLTSAGEIGYMAQVITHGSHLRSKVKKDKVVASVCEGNRGNFYGLGCVGEFAGQVECLSGKLYLGWFNRIVYQSRDGLGMLSGS